MARVLRFSASGFSAWRLRQPSARAREDQQLVQRIRTIHTASCGTYGASRVQVELREQGIAIARNRVARLLRVAGLQGVSRRRSVITTCREPGHQPAHDLVGRNFTAERPDQLWVADITYVPTMAGFLYLAIVLDVWSCRIIGWAMDTTLHTSLIMDAFNMAVAARRPSGVVHHSDRGSQYTSLAFGQRCEELGVKPSTGSVGDAYDNAMADAFFATLESELIDRHRFYSQAEVRMAVFQFIGGFYNPSRRH